MEKCIIVISHSNYLIRSAGIEKFISETSALLNSKGIHVLQVFPLIEVNRKLPYDYIGINFDDYFLGVYSEAHLFETLTSIGKSKNLRILGIDIHQIHGWNLHYLKKALVKLNLPINCFVHDHELVSADSLLDSSDGHTKKVIQQRDPKNCYGEANPAIMAEYHDFFDTLYSHIEKVIAPSHIAAYDWENSYPIFKDKMVIREHLYRTMLELKRSSEVSDPMRIAYLGTPAKHKGYDEWKTFVSTMQSDNHYSFYYFGKQEQHIPNVKDVHVDFQNPDSLPMTDQLMKHNIDIVFLWSICRETYCYTYYEAEAASCYILTNNESGNIQAQVKTDETGCIFTSLEQCLEWLSNTTNVKKTIAQYRASHKLESLSPNSNIDDLLFKHPGNLNYSGQKRIRSYKSFILTNVYRILRGAQR
ncbi:hypothetical protein PG2011B_1408 [Bifidobacterium animalis subsp. lactis]|uniref:Glycosyl transferase family 1 n=1 Tax=Bifidobacterium animalis subsp. lactis TaxID=302911 RepID=A0A8B3RHE5_BIFAN|nr:hypothetical protein PG2011B_1408 [Bifidobacterium animalis subsp. lactis]